MMYRSLLTLALVCTASAAYAKADVTVSIDAPAGLSVYEEGRFEVEVSNIGNRNADNVEVEIDLPQTATSPQVFVMGILGATSNSCVLADQTITCSLGRIRKNKSATVYFDIAFPVSLAPHTFTATASTTSSENSTNNNSASNTTNLAFYSAAVSAPREAHNRHCTGQGLQGFYECTLFPSSISSHDIRFEANGSITFLNAPPGYTGAWTQPTADRLEFDYYSDATLVASFSGYGVDNGCFEGMTLFPGSQWVSPYEVCLQ